MRSNFAPHSDAREARRHGHASCARRVGFNVKPYSGFAPEVFTTPAHLAISDLM